MKLKLLGCALALTASMGISHAQNAGTFGFGIELDGTGYYATSSGTDTLYALDNSGTTRLVPIEPAITGTTTSPVALNSSWTSSSTAGSPTFNLGTFGVGDTLYVEGGSMLTDKNSGGNVTASDLSYALISSTGTTTFTNVNLAFNQDNVNGNNGDQRWATEPGTNVTPGNGNTPYVPVNILAGLAPGTYTLDVYGYASSNVNNGNGGNLYESVGGANYGATFTVDAGVVPEPSTWAMMVGGLGLLLVIQRFRRKSVS